MKKVFSNFGLKVAGLFLALLLWFHATTDKIFVYGFDLPLAVSDLPSDLILTRPLPTQIKVRIKGKGKQLIKYFLSHKESVMIDANRLKALETDYAIKPEDVPLPKDLNLEVEGIDSPRQMEVSLDYFSQKEVSVRSQIDVLPQDGYVQVDSLKLNPKRVLLSGPRTLMRKVDQVDTEGKVLGSLSSSVSGFVSLVVPQGFNLKLSPDRVEYSVKIEKLIQKEFTQQKIRLANSPAKNKVKLLPESVKIVVQGTSQQLEKLEVGKIKVSLDFSKLGDKKEGKLAPKIELPKGVQLVKIEPDSVKFILE